MKRDIVAIEMILLGYVLRRNKITVTPAQSITFPCKSRGRMDRSISFYLNGGEYSRPPLVQSAFNPRSIPRGVLTPTFLSNISP